MKQVGRSVGCYQQPKVKAYCDMWEMLLAVIGRVEGVQPCTEFLLRGFNIKRINPTKLALVECNIHYVHYSALDKCDSRMG
jgi:hypothetical protein